MADFNNFANYTYIQARNFRQLKQQLSEIAVPCQLIKIEVRDNGSAYAILMLDRKEKSAVKRAKPQRTEVVDNSL